MTKILIIFSALFLFTTSPLQAKTLLDKIEMNWRPTTSLSIFDKVEYKYLTSVKIKIEKITDGREAADPQLIGQNSEDAPKILPVKTVSDIGEFYKNGMTDTMKKLGFDISDSNTDFTLGGKITHLFIEETNTYAGAMTMKVFLKKANKVVWETTIMVENKRFGRSYKLDNYMEVFSDLSIEVVSALLENEKFKASFGIKAPTPVAPKVPSANPNAKNLELKWTPTTELSAFNKIDYKSILNSKIKLEKFEDAREPNSLIGENIENPKNIRQLKTDSDVTDFYQKGLSETLKKLGFEISDSNKDYVLGGKLTHVFIKETKTYEGSLILKLHLKKGGNVVWQNVVNVENKRFGRSFKMENYLEVYSDLGIEALLKILDQSDFRKAFQTK